MGLAAAGVMAAAVVLLSGVDRPTTGAQPQRTSEPAREAPGRAHVSTEPQPTQSGVDEWRGPVLVPEAGGRTPGRESRKTALKAIVAAEDSTAAQADTLLADAALGNTDSAVREEAIFALGERGGTLAVQTLQQTIQDADPGIRGATIRALADIGTDEAARILGVALSERDASLRVDAVEALGDIGTPLAALYIRQVLRDESPPVREAAAQWLSELSTGRR